MGKTADEYFDMSDQKPIDVEAVPTQPQTQALAVRQEAGAVGRAMTLDELHSHLEFVRSVMRQEMKEGQDYGKIPGCGDKPSLLQPGAQKLLMVFNLTEAVRKEEIRDYPGFHREYAFTICVKAPNGKEWDGVGTCSTLEAKYRYRKAERKCPTCGHAAITPENPKFLKPGQVAGWFCWKKKGGCGKTFAKGDPAIAGQDGGKTENPDPAECWNTVRKMAFKRALVSASINATNTSELWTQDIEDTRGDPEPEAGHGVEPPGTSPSAPTSRREPPPPSSPPPASNRPTAAAQAPAAPQGLPTPEYRKKMIDNLAANPGQPNRVTVEDYFRKLENPAALMPNEPLENLPLRFVPKDKEQMKALFEAVSRFGNGDPAAHAFPPHPLAVDFDKPGGVKTPAQVLPKVTAEIEKKSKDPEWWRDVIVPVPHKGEKRDEYLKHPDTIGSLFDLRHGGDEEAAAARGRLFGFVSNYEPKGWTKRDGTEMPASETDKQFRVALDAFADWFEKNHPNEKL
jgi:hypothetical protein